MQKIYKAMLANAMAAAMQDKIVGLRIEIIDTDGARRVMNSSDDLRKPDDSPLFGEEDADRLLAELELASMDFSIH